MEKIVGFVTKQTSLSKRTGYFYKGKELALHKNTGFPAKEKRHNGSWYPEKIKIEAATMFAVTRNYEKTKELTGVAIHCLKKWSLEPWWDATIAEVKKLKNNQLDAKITEVLDQGIDLISDRFKEGEVYVDHRTKEQYRIPVKSKDAAIGISILFDKRQLLRGEATTRTETTSTEQKFLALKENFEKLAKSRQINPNSEPIEGELIEETSIDEKITPENLEKLSTTEQINETDESVQAQDVLEQESLSINPLGDQ